QTVGERTHPAADGSDVVRAAFRVLLLSGVEEAVCRFRDGVRVDGEGRGCTDHFEVVASAQAAREVDVLDGEVTVDVADRFGRDGIDARWGDRVWVEQPDYRSGVGRQADAHLARGHDDHGPNDTLSIRSVKSI